MKPITVSEFGSFVCKKDNEKENPYTNYTVLNEKQFNLLENFILSNSSKGVQPVELMGITAKKGVGKVITAKNYVGVITLKDGTTIEILPKIYGQNKSDEDETFVKKLLVKMLRSLNSAPFKTMQTSSLNTEKLPLFEIFIRLFLEEVFTIAKTGLLSGYNQILSNESFLKGKLDLNAQIKYNSVHRERFFVEYDEFNSDRPENRLLKSTLLYLQKNAKSAKNRADINTLLLTFTDVKRSINIASDFEKVVKTRNSKFYRTALSWAKIFLTGETFTAFAGKEYAQALLFPMEKLFEAYVAKQFAKYLDEKYSVLTQDKKYYLFENHPQFSLRPDIVISENDGAQVWIMDTKWKTVESEKDISQSDLYQMFAYYHKYKADKKEVINVTLLYPKQKNNVFVKDFVGNTINGNVVVKVGFVDLTDAQNSVAKIWESVNSQTI